MTTGYLLIWSRVHNKRREKNYPTSMILPNTPYCITACIIFGSSALTI